MRRPPISHREMQRYLERARQERAETIAKLLRRGAAHGASAFRAAAGWAFRLARTTVAAFARWRWQRATARELGALDDRALKDIGLRRSDIDHVAAQVAASPERRLDRSAPPAAWDAAKGADGKFYAVPFSAQSFALFIRKDWREKLAKADAGEN